MTRATGRLDSFTDAAFAPFGHAALAVSIGVFVWRYRWVQPESQPVPTA